MDFRADLKVLAHQETTLIFEHFNEAAAWRIGTRLREHATRNALPIAIDIRLFDRQLFFATLPGATANNQNWVRRKSNVVRHFLRSSYRIAHELALNSTDITTCHGIPTTDYAAAGGAFPITVRNTGVIGSITVSGLPDRLDHQLVVNALCEDLTPTNQATLQLANAPIP